jgi:hypothetical protein
MDAKDDLSWVTRNDHEDSEDSNGDQDERQQKNKESFD